MPSFLMRCLFLPHPKFRLGLALALSAGGPWLASRSHAQAFQIENLTLDAAGRPRLRHPSDPASYFVLLRGSSLSDLTHPVDAKLGLAGPGELADDRPLRTHAFYQVVRLPRERPLDHDRDGLDDVYELHRAPVLHPLQAADALEDADGDERSNLLEYQAGTDPQTPDFFVVTSPQHRETGISVNRETEFRFTTPLAPGTSLPGTRFWAEAGGRRLLTRAELSSDRKTASLFYLEPVPGLTRVRVFLDGGGLQDAAGRPLDLDGDGQPGGVAAIEFSTAGFTPVAGTAVVGRVFASEPVEDPVRPGTFTNRPLAGVTITVDGAEESLRTVTDAEGRFALSPSPAGRFFVHVDGRTVTEAGAGIRWPDLDYYPFVGKAWEATAGILTNVAGGTGEIYLPRISRDAFRNVSAGTETRLGFSPAVLAANPGLAGVEIAVPPNALFADDGTRGGRIGLAPVAPDRLPEPLPPGLSFPLVITVQTDGPQNFDQPVPVKFPNLPDPGTGRRLAPGEKSALWSFDHDKGVWEIVGPMTVSADGLLLVSDPGVGIRQPGWHGASPGTGGGGPPPGPPRPPKPPKPPRPPRSPPAPPPPPPPPAPAPPPAPDPGGGEGEGESPIPDFPDLPDLPFIDEPESWGDLVSMVADQLPTMGPDVFGPIVDIGKEVIDLAEDLNEVFENHGPVDSDGDGVPDVVESRDEMLNQMGESAGDLLPLPPESADDASDLLAEWWEIWNELYGGSGPALHAGRSRAGLPTPLSPPLAAIPHLTELRQETADLQRLATLQAAVDGYFEAVVGSNSWRTLASTGVQFREMLPILQAMSGAQQAGTDGGVLITAAESSAILALSTPRIPPSINTNLIMRLNQTVTENQRGRLRREEGPPGSPEIIDAAEERAAVLRLLAEINAEADAGFATPASRGQNLAARMGPALGGFLAAYLPAPVVEPSPQNEYPVLLEIFPPGGGFLEQYLKTDSRGQLDSVRVAAESLVIVRWLNPDSMQIATAFLASGPAGSRFTIPQAIWNERTPAADTDADGLPDAAERIVGTLPGTADSDGDGVSDGAEVRARTNPLDGVTLQPGIVGNADTPGRAVDLAVETYDLTAFGGPSSVTRILVADGPAGVAVLESVDGQPVRLGQLDTPGDARRVALPPSGSLLADEVALGAYADGAQGVGIIDFSDPVRPALRSRLTPEGTTLSVAIFGGVVYAGTDRGRLLAIDLFSGESIDELALGYPLQDLKVHRGTLFGGGPRGNLTTLQPVPLLEDGGFGTPGAGVSSVTGQTRRGMRLAVGDGLAYGVHGRGFSTWIITNLFAPALVAPGNSGQFGWFHLVPNGSGAGVACVGPNSTDDGPHDVSVYDLTDPHQTDRFVRTIITPGIAASAAIHGALAYVADTDAGVQVIQYQPTDRGTNPPVVTLQITGGHEVIAGSRISIDATAVDDVAVQEVELLVNGIRVATDHAWPFEFAFRAPPAQANIETNLIVQTRAVDTAGLAGWSAPATLRVVPDTVSPQVVRIEPGAGRIIPGETSFLVAFNEPLDLATVSSNTIQVQSSGADTVFGTADDRLVTEGTFGFLERGNRVFLGFPEGLPHGDYRLVVAGSIRDASGNVMGTAFSSEFKVREFDLRGGGSFPGENRLPAIGTRDVYRFLGSAGQRVFVDLQDGGGVGLRWTLLDPTGAKVFEQAAFFDVGTVELPRDGRYELILELVSGAAADYRFTVWDVTAPQTWTIAIGDSVGDGRPGTGAGRIESPGVQDVYVFTARPGQNVFFDLQAGGSANTHWRLVDDGGSEVFSEGLFFDPGMITLTRGGTYTLTVGNPRTDFQGAYRFQLWDVPATQEFGIAIGDTVGNGFPATGAGRIESPGVLDEFTFTAAPGQVVFFDLVEGATAAIRWRLLDTERKVVFEEGLFFDPGTIPLARGGTYTLTVGNRRSDYQGAYRFRLVDVPAAQRFAIAVDDTIGDGAPAPGAGRIETPGAQDIYTFTAAAGQTVFFDLLEGATAHLQWRLQDEVGAQVFQEGFFFDPGVVTLTRGGSYTLTIGNPRNDYTGTYRFRIWDVVPTQRFAIAVGDTVRAGLPAAGAGQIEIPGTLDIYTFTATPGQRVFFDLQDGLRAAWSWRLIDETGAEVFNAGFFFDPGEKALVRGGGYMLIVGNPGSDVTGTYQFQIRPAP